MEEWRYLHLLDECSELLLISYITNVNLQELICPSIDFFPSKERTILRLLLIFLFFLFVAAHPSIEP